MKLFIVHTALALAAVGRHVLAGCPAHLPVSNGGCLRALAIAMTTILSIIFIPFGFVKIIFSPCVDYTGISNYLKRLNRFCVCEEHCIYFCTKLVMINYSGSLLDGVDCSPIAFTPILYILLLNRFMEKKTLLMFSYLYMRTRGICKEYD